MRNKESKFILSGDKYRDLAEASKGGFKALGEAAKASAKGGWKAIRPGQGPFETANDQLSKLLTKDKLIPGLSLGGLGALGLYSMQSEMENPRSQIGQQLSEARHVGETPMSTPFDSFVSRRRNTQPTRRRVRRRRKTSSRNKEANIKRKIKELFMSGKQGIKDILGGGAKASRSGTNKRVTPAGTARVRKAKQVGGQSGQSGGGGNTLRNAALTGAGGLGLIGLEALEDTLNPISQTAGEQMSNSMFGAGATAGADQARAKARAKALGQAQVGVPQKGLESIVGEIGKQLGQKGMSAAGSIPNMMQHSSTFQKAIQSDDMLRDLNHQEKEIAKKAFKTLKRFAPSLATDEFAVANFLRESVVSGRGPDYATISNIAKTNRDVNR